MRILGLDVGIASIGWGLLEFDASACRIVAAGVWAFDAPETDKERTPTNQIRREKRGMRRVIRGRRQRMNAIRVLFASEGLLTDADKDALKRRGDDGMALDPWRFRAEGLDRLLTHEELALALGHIARHRGFRSNAKRDAGANAADETSKMKSAIAKTQEMLTSRGWRTVGEMLARDPEFVGRRRNRTGDYSRSLLRGDQEAETRKLFAAQLRLGSQVATTDFEARFADLAFSQRPLQDSDDKVGPCPFEPDERRAARRAYSFELFRLISRLTSIRLSIGRSEEALTPEQNALVCANFGSPKQITWKRLRDLFKLAPDIRFAGVAPKDEGKDFVARSGNAAEGTYALRTALGDSPWRSLIATPDVLDLIAEVLTFREDETSIRTGLIEALGSHEGSGLIVDQLMKALAAGKFKEFKGAGHVSAKACRNLLPHLARGLVYSEACEAAGYDHARSRISVAIDLGDDHGTAAIRRLLREENETRRLHTMIANPIARKAVTETLKQAKAIVEAYGLPDYIHLELARDVGKNKEERDEISRGIEDRNEERDRMRKRFRETLGADASRDDLLRYELWEEQLGKCVYTDDAIPVTAVIMTDNSVQVDHILPWSRFGDDSFINRTLCTARANQMKRGRTPFEWFSEDLSATEWDRYVARVENLKSMKGRKKRNYVLKNAAEKEEGFRTRNLNDTRYAARVLGDLLKLLYPKGQRGGTKGSEVRVQARPGALTAKLRQAWGIEGLKKVDGARVEDDRHHAVDAMVLAATSQSMLKRLTRAFQEAEHLGLPREFKGMEQPWPGFREAVEAARDGIFVARAERRRARGEAHAATIRQVAERDGKPVVYERKLIEKLTASDLDRVKDPDRNASVIEALREWLEAGKPKDRKPLSPKGDPIGKVKLSTGKKPDLIVRDGAVDRGEMARVDVFRKPNPKGVFQYFLVPIYPHQIAAMDAPPAKAVVGNAVEADWTTVDSNYEFLWSLALLSRIDIVKPDGEIICGYFRKLDRNTGAITISPHVTLQEIRRSIGPRTLRDFKKFTVDRLGRNYIVDRETRTWRGKVCT